MQTVDWQSRFHNIIDKDVDAHIVIDSSGQVLYANLAAQKLLNRSVEEFGRQAFEFPLHPSESTEICLIWEGQPRVAEMRVVETEWDGRPAFLASVRDWTAQHKMAEALRKNEARMRAFLEQAAEGVIITDAYGVVQSFNKAAEQIFGYSATEVCGQNVSLLMPENYRAKHEAYLRNFRLNGNAPLSGRSLELVGRRKDGTLLPVDSNAREFFDGEQWLFIAILRDITFRKESERELRLWAKVFENALAAVVITDAEGTIQTASRSFTKTTGYTAREVIGQNPRLLKSGRHDREFYQFMWNSLIEKGHWEGEIWNKRKNGEIYPEWLSISASRDSQGRVTHYVAIFRDITADTQLREEVILAGRIQKGSLRPDLTNNFIQMSSVYRPFHYVSGDYYDYRWDEKHHVFHGFLLDVMGHGLATALQISALRVLFRQATEKDVPLRERVAWINREIMPCLADGSFGAAICFDLDFATGTIMLCSAGINYVLQIREGALRILTVPGLFLGISPDEEYDGYSLPMQEGDVYIFLTDGLFDVLNLREEPAGIDCQAVWQSITTMAESDGLTDDATAVCLEVKSINRYEDSQG